MRDVDFGYVSLDGDTIYKRCFEKYLKSRFRLKRPKSEWSEVVTETEAIFDFLVEQGIDNGYDVDLILEIPDSTALTCYSIALQCSEKICDFLIGRGIKVNSIVV